MILVLGPLAAAALAWRGHPLARALALVVGVALLVWLVVEICIVGYESNPPLQPPHLGLGIAITLLAVAWMRDTTGGFARRASSA